MVNTHLRLGVVLCAVATSCSSVERKGMLILKPAGRITESIGFDWPSNGGEVSRDVVLEGPREVKVSWGDGELSVPATHVSLAQRSGRIATILVSIALVAGSMEEALDYVLMLMRRSRLAPSEQSLANIERWRRAGEPRTVLESGPWVVVSTPIEAPPGAASIDVSIRRMHDGKYIFVLGVVASGW